MIRFLSARHSGDARSDVGESPPTEKYDAFASGSQTQPQSPTGLGWPVDVNQRREDTLDCVQMASTNPCTTNMDKRRHQPPQPLPISSASPWHRVQRRTQPRRTRRTDAGHVPRYATRARSHSRTHGAASKGKSSHSQDHRTVGRLDPPGAVDGPSEPPRRSRKEVTVMLRLCACDISAIHSASPPMFGLTALSAWG